MGAVKFGLFTTILLIWARGLFASPFQVADSAIISGSVQIVWARQITLGNVTITLDSTGNFTHRTWIRAANYMVFSHEDRKVKLFLQPGDSIHIDWRGRAINISGRHAELNRSLQDHEAVTLRNGRYLDENNSVIFSKPIAEFQTIIDSLQYVEQASLLGLHGLYKPLPPPLASRLKADINNRIRFYRLLYPGNFNRHTRRPAKVPGDYAEQVTKVDFNHPELISSPEFVRLVNYYVDMKSAGRFQYFHLERAPKERLTSRYNSIISLNVDDTVRNFFVEQHFISALNNHSVKNLSTSLSLFNETFKHSYLQKRVNGIVQDNLSVRKQPNEIQIYRRVGKVSLEAHIFHPIPRKPAIKQPAYLFFHGGGWAIGKPEWGYENCRAFAQKGFVSISFEYRLRNVYGSPIRDAVEDALAAVSWVKANASKLNIDTSHIIAAGFSSGAHLAACAATLDPLKIFVHPLPFSPKPAAVILQSAPYSVRNRDVINSSTKPELISPLNHIEKLPCPVLAFHGEMDDLVNVKEFEQFVASMQKSGGKLTYHLFKGGGHFYFGPESFQIMNEMTELFLKKYGLRSND